MSQISGGIVGFSGYSTFVGIELASFIAFPHGSGYLSNCREV
jgi:hypothetical protein